MIGILANTRSCHGRGSDIWREVRDSLQKSSIPHIAELTSKAGEADELTSRLVSENSLKKALKLYLPRLP